MNNIYIGQHNYIQNCIITGNGEIIINGVKMPPCPKRDNNSTITMVNNKIYLNGYELVNGQWKKTLRALWHKWF